LTCRSESPVKERPLHIPLTEPLYTKRCSSSRAFFYASFRVPSKGVLPPGFPHRIPIERDAPFPDPSFTCLSKYPVKQPPLQVLPSGALWEEKPVSRAFLYLPFRVPSKEALPPGSPLRSPIP
jgi:hypothetical protein